MCKTLIDALAVAAVFLMDDGHNIRVFFPVAVGNLPGGILGAIVNDDDLHPVASGQQAVHTFFHIVLRVVAGNGYGQQFHITSSLF